MRIALFSECYTPTANGVVTYLVTLRDGLRTLGHTVYIFAPGSPESEADPNVFRLPELPFPNYPFHFARPFLHSPVNFAELDIDIVHCQHPFTVGRLGADLARKHNLPLVYTAHSLYDKMAGFARSRVARSIGQGLAHSIVRRFCDRVDCVMVPTREVQASLEADGVLARFAVVPNGVTPPLIRPEARQEKRAALELAPDTPLLLSVGRLAPEKRVDVLLHAADSLRDRNLPIRLADFRLAFVGDGQVRAQMESLASDLKLSDRVIFAGSQPRESLGDWYAAGDLFLLASPAETQGIVLIEAMAAGLPCIAANSGGPLELITSDHNGLLVPLDPAAFADAAQFLLLDAARRETIRQNGLARARDFTPEAMTQNILAVYESVSKKPI